MFRCIEFSFLAQKMDFGGKGKLRVSSGEEQPRDKFPSLKGF